MARRTVRKKRYWEDDPMPKPKRRPSTLLKIGARVGLVGYDAQPGTIVDIDSFGNYVVKWDDGSVSPLMDDSTVRPTSRTDLDLMRRGRGRGRSNPYYALNNPSLGSGRCDFCRSPIVDYCLRCNAGFCQAHAAGGADKLCVECGRDVEDIGAAFVAEPAYGAWLSGYPGRLPRANGFRGQIANPYYVLNPRRQSLKQKLISFDFWNQGWEDFEEGKYSPPRDPERARDYESGYQSSATDARAAARAERKRRRRR